MNHQRARRLLGDHLDGGLAAADRTALDAHLGECPECAREATELRRLVALLRSLPEPGAPAGLVESVMRRVETGEARPPRLLDGLRSFAEPRLGLALAAGIAGLLLFASLENPHLGLLGSVAGGLAQPERRPSVALPPATDVQTAGIAAFAAGPRADARPILRIAAASQRDRELDRLLDRVFDDPEAFFARLDASSGNRRVLARLAERAARRGDGVGVAGRLLSTGHPVAEELATRFLQASLVAPYRRPPVQTVGGVAPH